MANAVNELVTEVVLGGGPNANPQERTVVPNAGKTSTDLAAEAKNSRFSRFGKIVEMVKTDKVDLSPYRAGQGQQVAAPGQTTPTGATEAAEESEAAASEAEEAQDPVGQDESPAGQGAPEQSKMDRIEAARAKARADAVRNRARQSQSRQRDAETDRLRQQNAILLQQAQAGQQLQQTLVKDPLAAFKQVGLTTEQLVQQALQDGSPEGKIAALQQLVERERDERLKLVRQSQEKEFATGLKAAEEDIWQRSRNVEKYPNLQGQPRSLLIPAIKTLVKEAKDDYYRRTGLMAPPISDAQILRYVNDQFEGEKQVAANSKATGSAKTNGKQAAAGSTKAPQPRTLTNGLTNGGLSRPKNFESLSRSEREKILKQELRHK